jgi:hypothetical protein
VPPRQVWLFQFGCWAAVAAALVHLAGRLFWPPAPSNDTERQLIELAATYRFALPGGAARTLSDVTTGHSLIAAVLFAALGALGLIVAKRGQADAELMYVTARTATIASAAVLFISLTHFFVVPTMLFAAVTVCFAVSAVRAPQG